MIAESKVNAEAGLGRQLSSQQIANLSTHNTPTTSQARVVQPRVAQAPDAMFHVAPAPAPLSNTLHTPTHAYPLSNTLHTSTHAHPLSHILSHTHTPCQHTHTHPHLAKRAWCRPVFHAVLMSQLSSLSGKVPRGSIVSTLLHSLRVEETNTADIKFVDAAGRERGATRK